MASDLPIIGACLPVDVIATYQNWLFDSDRDIELQSFHSADVLDGDWRAVADEANRLLNGYRGRIGIHGPFWGFTIDSFEPQVRRVVENRMMQGLEVCEAVDATQMVIHSPYSTWGHNNMDNIPGTRERIVELTHDTLSKVVRRAEDLGVTLVIENISDIAPSDRRMLAASFGTDRVKLSVDTGHAHYAHGSTGAPPVDYFIQDAGEALEHVHLQDADGYADRHWAIGEGTILWPSVFRAVARLEQKPRLLLELRNKDDIPPSMRFLEEAKLGR